jgi:hypothetical protein
VNSHLAIPAFLGTVLGDGLDRIQAFNQSRVSPHQNMLVDTALGQRFVHGILADGTTYDILQSPAFNSLIGSERVSGRAPTGQGAQDSVTAAAAAAALATANPASFTATPTTTTPTTTPTTTTPTITTPGTATATEQLVAFSVPQQATVVSIGTEVALIQVNPVGEIPGFFTQVPATNIRVLDPGPPLTGSVLVPISALPPGFPIPASTSIPVGTYASTYSSTAALLAQMINAGTPQVAPNAPNTVPGLRLVPYLQQNRLFPGAREQALFQRILRLAVQRKVFNLSAFQSQSLSAGVASFTDQVNALNEAGQFQPTLPPTAPTLPTGPLSRTMEVSAGVFRSLVSVDPNVSGLLLPGVGNFPGRLDVGFVFDAAGNYGIILTARGPLLNANPDLTDVDLAGGDLRVTVSNAPNLAALGGLRTMEGVLMGSITSAELEASNFGGVSTFSASAGNGLGLEYGTGVAYSQVIPLGNVYSLIPEAPRRR